MTWLVSHPEDNHPTAKETPPVTTTDTRWVGHCSHPTPCPRPGKPCACGEEVREEIR